jgi:hypothetical protein
MRNLKSKLTMPAKKAADMEVEEDLSLEGLDLEDSESEPSEDADPAMDMEVGSTDSEVEGMPSLEDLSDDELLSEVRARGLKLEDMEAEEADAEAPEEDAELDAAELDIEE